MMEHDLMTVAQQFAKEVRTLEGLNSGTRAQIVLQVGWVGWKDGAPKVTLICYFNTPGSGSSQSVVAASLEQLMHEVHRRCGFADKMILAQDQNDRALQALTDQREDL